MVVSQEQEWWEARTRTKEIAFEAIAADEDAWTGACLQRNLHEILSAIEPCCAQEEHPVVVDLGCGMGRLTLPVAARLPHAQIVGVDFSEGMLKLAAERTPASITNVRWLHCNGETLPGDLERVQAVFSMITLQHVSLAVARSYIEDIARKIVTGGVFRFQVLEGTASVFLATYMSEAWLRATCSSAGLQVESVDRAIADNSGDTAILWITARKP